MILLSFACVTPEDDSGTPDDAVDLRITEADLPSVGDDQIEWWGADVVIEPGEDVFWCTVGTYDGPEMGIHEDVTYQSRYGHHFALMGTTASELDYPDGSTFNCTDASTYMVEQEPLAIATSAYVDGQKLASELPMLDGMAVKLDQGQRYMLQSHYLNTGTDRIRVQDVIQLSLLDPETEVETWASPYVLDGEAFELAPQSAESLTFSCTAETDWSVVYMLPHMHEWGTAFSLDHQHGDETTRLIDVPNWDPYFRDAPPVQTYEAGALSIAAGDVLTTSCEWFNDTDEPIVFPHEMCISVGLVYPQLTTVICEDGEQ